MTPFQRMMEAAFVAAKSEPNIVAKMLYHASPLVQQYTSGARSDYKYLDKLIPIDSEYVQFLRDRLDGKSTPSLSFHSTITVHMDYRAPDFPRIEHYPRLAQPFRYAYATEVFHGVVMKAITMYMTRGTQILWDERWTNALTTVVKTLPIQPGFRAVDVLYMIANSKIPVKATSMKLYRALMTGQIQKMKAKSNTYHKLFGFEYLYELVQSMPVEERPIVAYELANTRRSFIFAHLDKPWIVHFLSQIPMSMCPIHAGQIETIISTQLSVAGFDALRELVRPKHFDYLLKLIYYSVDPATGCRLPEHEAHDHDFNHYYPIGSLIPSIALDIVRQTDLYLPPVQILTCDTHREADYWWLYHLFLMLGDGYLTPASRATRLISRLPLNYYEGILRTPVKRRVRLYEHRCWPPIACEHEFFDTYEEFLQCYKWIAFL